VDNTVRVLVVDDERGVRDGCRRIVSRRAGRVDTAETAEEAVSIFEPGRYDIALVDIKMPGMSGLDLLDVFRAKDPDLASIVITGFATLDTAIEATRRGAYDFLPKPFSPDELMAKLESAIQRRRLAMETKHLREERERRLLEIATEKSRLRTVINCMQDGVVVINRAGQVVLYNPAAARMLLLRGTEIIGLPAATSLAQPDLVEMLGHIMDEQCPHEMLVRELPGKEATLTLMVNVAAVRDEVGGKLGAVAVLRDITELKAIDKAKSEFVSMVSHELRAPLAAIDGYLNLIITGRVKGDLEEERSMLLRSRDRAQALLALIDDLLDVSRLEAGQVSRDVESLVVAQVADEVVALLRPAAEAEGVTIHQEIPANIPLVAADHEDLARLLTNLVSNAVKYNHPGGELWLHGVVDGQYLCIEVADTGIGIPANAIGHIFDEFYRVKRPETRQITGTGLGLTIAKKIVESYHGSISVSSELGVGTRFTVRLPVSPQRAPQSQ
jgi:PAS domain S-box-containing protein